MPRFLLLFFSFFVFLFAEAQTPSSINYLQLEWERQARLDSLQDSTLRAQDSLKMLWIGAPDKKGPIFSWIVLKKAEQ